MMCRVRGAVRWWLTFSWVLAFPVRAGEEALTVAAKPRDVLATTYAERCAASCLSHPAEAPELALPQPHAANLLPGPVRVESGALPLRYPDQAAVVWLRVPWKEAHATYLEKRASLLDDAQGQALVDWCEQQKLPECAEYELRRLLFRHFMDFRDPAYQRLNQRWLKYASRREAGYVFPLPAEGEWYVMPDTTGHHRIKAGAAFAFDLVVMNGGRLFKNTGRQLEDHYAWGRPIVAQADGVVVSVRNDFPDGPVGSVGGFDQANAVTVDYGAGLVGLYAHCQKGSAKVQPGDRVQAGQVLAAVGNSGASGLPHLHFTLCDRANFSVKGRFRCAVLEDTRWRLVDGENLREGVTVRNPTKEDLANARK